MLLDTMLSDIKSMYRKQSCFYISDLSLENKYKNYNLSVKVKFLESNEKLYNIITKATSNIIKESKGNIIHGRI